ncbi:hypothetical protein WR25_06789 isoform C [Diploscapter pachys]|uniref:Fibrinogen C-terminal domain-containing protein n=2 Tax=Diploscapter pachys TaxID=2018661 RepID=A0A2A2KE48_9BILA|nr:hypothetical protein WR25_06789 isoform C [Diploscapter pachys]
MTSCPATCANATLDPFCEYGCSEGCECDDGYVLDNNNLDQVTCVPVEQCGCVDGNGNSHPGNQTWLSNNCTVWNICSNGTWYSKPNFCSLYAYCGVDDNFMPVCVCDPGFFGDGYNCTSIDYCADNSTCHQAEGHGTCTDTPGNYTCNCTGFWDGRDCELYQPRRHCADLYVYHGYKTDGVYTINPPFEFAGRPAYSNVSVYCTMTQNDGGWTLMSHDTGSLMANKTHTDYINGFGTWEDVIGWLGLDIIHGLTNLHNTSLRLDLVHCASNGVPEASTDCTYKFFTVQDKTTNYSVIIPQVCNGTEKEYYDGWARWNLTEPGPGFATYDDDDKGSCSSHFRNTGWWFDTSNRCGSANLNGIRFTCNNMPPVADQQTYLFWGGSPLGQVRYF